jgi:predicted acylesterase/phospholipase RssA/CRP-like cAMP-binding protein
MPTDSQPARADGRDRSPSALIAWLGSIPLFSDCSADGLALLANGSDVVSVAAGARVYRQGDPAESMAIVRSGRLVISTEGPDGRGVVVTRAGPDSVIGELGVLVGSPRSASVIAARDSEILMVRREVFEAALARDPALTLGIARDLGARLQRSVDADVEQPRFSVLALVAAGPEVALDPLVVACREQLRGAGSVACLDERTPKPFSHAVDRAEAEAEWTLLVVRREADEEWRSFCLGSADRVAFLADRRTTAADVPRGLPIGDLVFTDGLPPPSRLHELLTSLRPRTHHVVRTGDRYLADVRRLVRRLSGRAVSLVLSGGGARGLAHLGVLERLTRAGVEIDAVVGCSMGSFIGSMEGLEWSPERMIATARAELVERRPFNDYTVPRIALIRARKARVMLARTFGSATLEQMPRPTYVVSSDLDSGDLVVHADGLVRDAVGASMSIPGLAPPLASNGRLLVDGGLIDNLPVDAVRAREPGFVIAVDVMRQWQGSGSNRTLPSIVETVTRATFLSSRKRAVTSRQDADVLILPEVGDISLLQFDRFDRAVAAGRRAADELLQKGLIPRRSIDDQCAGR